MAKGLTDKELSILKQMQERLQRRIALHEMKKDVENSKNRYVDLESKYKAFNR